MFDFRVNTDFSRNDLFLAMSTAVLYAGGEIMNIYNNNSFKVFTKDNKEVKNKDILNEISNKFKTDADIASHNAIASVLDDFIINKQMFKEVPIIYEEADFTYADKEQYISVDELDGTGRFMKRLPGFMVLMQYVEKGKPKLSVNFDPLNDVVYYARENKGSFSNNKKECIKTNQEVNLDNVRIIINGRDAVMPENKDYFEFMKSRFKDNLSCGLATGSRIAAILDNKYDAFVNFGSELLHVWDLGMVLNLIEAGGVATKKDGSELNFKNPSIIDSLVCSSNPKLQEEIISFLQTYN